eukprot:1392103-Amorphochlora_amoeboformis.AAC.2
MGIPDVTLPDCDSICETCKAKGAIGTTDTSDIRTSRHRSYPLPGPVTLEPGLPGNNKSTGTPRTRGTYMTCVR